MANYLGVDNPVNTKFYQNVLRIFNIYEQNISLIMPAMLRYVETSNNLMFQRKENVAVMYQQYLTWSPCQNFKEIML